MITAILIDDEKNCTEVLQLQLEKRCPEVDVLAVHNDPVEGIQSVKKLQPDVLFLDVEMPVANGFEVLRQLQPLSCEVIFTTAHADYAIQAIRFSALDYLTKPIQDIELLSAVNRLKEKNLKSAMDARLDLLLEHVQQPSKQLDRIALATSDSVEIVDVAHIIYCEAQSNYTMVHFTNNKKLLVSKTLKQIEELLKQHAFFRVHQSYLVNLKMIKKYVRSAGGYVMLENVKEPISVSQSRRESLQRKLNM